MIRAFLFLIQPLGWGSGRPSARSESVGTSRPPVLLVIGPPFNGSALSLVKLFLRSRDWHWLWAVSCGKGPLADQAAHVEKRALALLSRAQTAQIDIVAHGCSGLAVAWFLRHSEQHTKIRRVVSLGTPWEGTHMAAFGALRQQFIELSPGSAVLDGLKDTPVHTVSIWSRQDTHVVPAHSAAPEWVKTVELDGAGTLDLLTSPRALRAIQTALDSPDSSGR
jgi:triacylglycerol lipase